MKSKNEETSVCPVCNSLVELVFVHGHYQCPCCRQIIYSCCEGIESARKNEDEINVESEKISNKSIQLKLNFGKSEEF
ncbi:MAG: hypothetical protein OZ913_02490 [Ignavibacteriaceae bacterium]|jgi:hypothetical protein|nr:MAG: hypothetical protein EDM69_05415 [Chlorobiota bacterium]MBW7856194.1 hypothetical protein [Ignavibacteria bacterium]MCC6885742.1 hypothetical protein [Ignavibacteriales bacterium]MCE7953063.1 hypothetical protein [Chlorobi bacterium CHB7]MDL1887099.1 hypothetical protein [Ignavibacteria bacterium CHB1]MEB2329154.1 hypothetical protein [Ignavibacteriaceae bacterium]OQY77992.1 MAG: hypothetical protein B6D43_05620 [Ignavibacteriales bacterium UTCHB1]RIK49881.1 MAG: hypothetical protein